MKNDFDTLYGNLMYLDESRGYVPFGSYELVKIDLNDKFITKEKKQPEKPN